MVEKNQSFAAGSFSGLWFPCGGAYVGFAPRHIKR
jgi:hypothetical protein